MWNYKWKLLLFGILIWKYMQFCIPENDSILTPFFFFNPDINSAYFFFLMHLLHLMAHQQLLFSRCVNSFCLTAFLSPSPALYHLDYWFILLRVGFIILWCDFPIFKSQIRSQYITPLWQKKQTSVTKTDDADALPFAFWYERIGNITHFAQERIYEKIFDSSDHRRFLIHNSKAIWKYQYSTNSEICFSLLYKLYTKHVTNKQK